MNIALYAFAGIGALTVTIPVILLLGWVFAHALAKAILRRRDRLTASANQ